jgi:serine/threonine protein kinase
MNTNPQISSFPESITNKYQILEEMGRGAFSNVYKIQSKIDNKNIHDAIVSLTAEALNVKDSLEKEVNKIIKEAESKNNEEYVDIKVE